MAYLIQYLEKWQRSLWCRSGRVEATAIMMCHGKLNCWPINSVYRFNLKVPARPINAKHTLRLLLRTIKISANKLFIDYTVTLSLILYAIMLKSSLIYFYGMTALLNYAMSICYQGFLVEC